MKQTLLKYWFQFSMLVTEKWRNHKARPKALKRAIRKAKRLQRRNKRRYRVLFLQNHYQCLTRDQVKQKKREGIFSKNINVTKMEMMCFYDTLTGTPDFAKQLLNAKN